MSIRGFSQMHKALFVSLSTLLALTTPDFAMDIEGHERSLVPSKGSIADEFAAHGIINCDGADKGSAALVGSANVIVTAAHVLRVNGTSGSNCVNRLAHQQCSFVTIYRDERVSIPLMNDYEVEFDEKRCNFEGPERHKDWTAVRLTRNAPDGLKPLEIGDGEETYQLVNVVTGRNLDLIDEDWVSENGAARAISSCVWPEPINHLHVQTYCSGTWGGSGSAAINTVTGRFVGVFVTGTESKDEVMHQRSVGSIETCSPDPLHCGTTFAALGGNFRSKLLEFIQTTK